MHKLPATPDNVLSIACAFLDEHGNIPRPVLRAIRRTVTRKVMEEVERMCDEHLVRLRLRVLDQSERACEMLHGLPRTIENLLCIAEAFLADTGEVPADLYAYVSYSVADVRELDDFEQQLAVLQEKHRRPGPERARLLLRDLPSTLENQRVILEAFMEDVGYVPQSVLRGLLRSAIGRGELAGFDRMLAELSAECARRRAMRA
jgi:hypothetical protein